MIRLILLLLATLLPLQANAQPLCVCLRCALLTHAGFYAPASSMHPTLPVDGCMEGRYLRADEPVPPPGSVVTFVHPVSGDVFVKRIVAREGQTVQMIGGELHIDGAAVVREPMRPFEEVFERSSSGSLPQCGETVALGEICRTEQWAETLPNGTTYGILDLRSDAPGDDTELFTVPPGHVFVLGDHRDNSVDSRFPPSFGGIGMVPVENLRTIIDSPPTSFE